MHLASPASPPAYLQRPIETLDVDSLGTRNLLELARHHGERFFLASTSEVYGDPLVQTRSFCYVDDEISGFLALLDSSITGPVNIGNPAEFTMLELAELVLELTGSSSDLVFDEPPSDDPKVRCPDITLARTGPTVDLRDGLLRMIDWFRQQTPARSVPAPTR